MTRDNALFLDDSFPLPVDRPFTRSMALGAGLTDRRLGALVRDGCLRRSIESVYVPTQVPDGLDLRAETLLLVVPDGCFVCDETAAWLHGAPMAMAPNSHLEVPKVSYFRPADAGRLRNKLVTSGERTLTEDDLMEVRGILTTTPLRTALDLGRLRRRDQALAALDALLRLGVFTHEELLASIERFARQRGVVQLRWLVPLADGRAESAGESALRLRWYDAGLPRPQLQIEIVVDGKVVFRLDLGLEELLFAAEYDGVEWHSSDDQVEADDSRRGWLAEQRRWLIEVFGKANVHGFHQDADRRLAAAFQQAKATYGTRTFII
ncbi:hypothetical protein GCM10009844_25440 [Nocardioides koreensis]|uniref:Transcriptional regulator, AbiEi antitoxin, Type IV TA system n=1 Tax=Nocardioides koreensis TaxID=433651 RepID=A0ABP5LMU2_9ACTN